MTRFFVQPEQIEGERVVLDGDDAHHLRVVLQASAGDQIAILDGSGREWPATLETLGKTRGVAHLGTPFFPQTEPETQITIAQALPKMADKMEQVLQRGTEIGAARFWAFQSERSHSHLSGERHDKRLGRWRTIIKTAAEQAHRACLPALQVEGSLQDVLATVPNYDLALIAHPDKTCQSLSGTLANHPRTCLLLVGPESGFTQAEVSQAQGAGAQAVTLGPRILRTETAALVMAAQILYALETPVVR